MRGLLSLGLGLLMLAQPASLTLPNLSPDTPVTGTVIGDTSAQLYRLRGTAGDTVTVTMAANDNALDAFLVLLDGAGAVIAANDDRTPDTLDAALAGVTLPASGDYLLLAIPFENLDEFLTLAPPEPLDYTLTASGFAPPTGGTSAPLATTPLTLGVPAVVESTAARPVAYLTFDAAAGDTLDVVARRVAGIDPVLHVFGPDGARVAFDDDDDTSRTFTVDAAVYGLRVPADGRYLVLATDTFFYNAPTPAAALRYSPGTLTVEVRRTPTPLGPGN